jgi:hypothetical protein
MSNTATVIHDDGNTRVVEYRTNGVLVCTSTEPSAAIASAQATAAAATVAATQVLESLVDPALPDPATADVLKALATLALDAQ